MRPLAILALATFGLAACGRHYDATCEQTLDTVRAELARDDLTPNARALDEKMYATAVDNCG